MARIIAAANDGETFDSSRPVTCCVNRTRAEVRRGLLLAGLGLGLSALSGCAWLSAKEREAVLRPSPGRPAAFAQDGAGLRPGDQRYVLRVMGEQGREEALAIWWLPQADAAAPTLLYLHGTLRNLYENLPKIDALREAGFAIVAVDYRGWGDSEAIIPSEATITADSRTAFAELVKRQPDPRRRVIFGHSMGGSAAVTLASGLHAGQDYGALILESTFTRMPDVAREAGTIGRVAAAVTSLEFDSIGKIGRVDAPILMLHGSADKTVPVVLGRRLRDAADKAAAAAGKPGVRWVEFPEGSHSGLHRESPDLYQAALKSLISTLK